MKKTDRLNRSNRSAQFGQSMIEYTIVLAFGVLVLTTGPMQDTIAQLTQRVQDHYEGYSYAISLSDIPDADNPLELYNLYTNQGLPDDLVLYLTDFPDGFLSALANYAAKPFPDPGEGKKLIDDIIGNILP